MNENRAMLASKEITPVDFLDYRVYLKALYTKAKNNKKAYSVRKFSDDLGFGVSTLLHQIIKGYRPLTERNGQKIVVALQLEAEAGQYFIHMIGYSNAAETHIKDKHFAKLIDIKSRCLPEQEDKDVLTYFSEWHHPVIREMILLEDFSEKPEWIASKLVAKITEAQAEESLALLKRLGFIAYDEDSSRLQQTESRLATSSRVKGMGLLTYHQQMIDFGRLSLTTIKGRRRNISSVTVCTGENTLKKINALINTLQIQILDLVDQEEKGDQVYQVNVQMFPFTKE